MRPQFRDVKFCYPSRPNQTILEDFSLEVTPGETVAFVGESGSGKSTLIGLMQRFYDVQSGTILVDGVPIKDLNVKSLRSNIGIVSQMPMLFDSTVAENIRWGANEDTPVTQAQIEAAAKMANAHEFITGLEEGYDTRVGERGTQLSGGQKQRVCIARAIIRNPKILMLDEATSAVR